MKKLPIWLQSFEQVREKESNFVYIDKTKYVYNMIYMNPRPRLFLSRPRRFGKSLLVDTMRCMFEWKKELFEWLYVYDKWNWEDKYPVLAFQWWNWVVEDSAYLERHLNFVLNDYFKKFQIESIWENIPDRLQELIIWVSEKTGKQVVVLIDEYDKPILDRIEQKEKAEWIREVLKWFYSILKWADQYLKFVFIAGVTKFSKVSLFSGLNNLEDLTLNSNFGAICGYTHADILESFGPEGYLDWVDLETMRKWYNWFNFLGKDKVYNPFDVLLFFREHKYANHWFQTATPTFLLKLLKSYPEFYHLPNLENISVWEEILSSFDIEKINIETLLFQTGYLTIKEVESNPIDQTLKYRLGIPNFEIEKSLNIYLVSDYLESINNVQYYAFADKVIKALYNQNVEEFINLLKGLFAGIAYSNIERFAKHEWYYTSVIYAMLYAIGFDVIQEDITSQWRIDLTLRLPNCIYVMEFKVDKEPQTAMKQIKDRKYHEKYINDGKPLYLLGIDFGFDERNVKWYECEKVK